VTLWEVLAGGVVNDIKSYHNPELCGSEWHMELNATLSKIIEM